MSFCKSLIISLTIFSLIAVTPSAYARDDKLMFPINNALNAPTAKERLEGIRFYFGDQKHPKVLNNFGEFRTNKKTNAFNKSDKEACEWVFLSAMLALQDRARREGGDAVINIKSNYRNKETVSATEFECGAGVFLAGVALKGTVVKLAK